MKTVVCYGDSNVWGFIPGSEKAFYARYPKQKRWTGILAAKLGPDFDVIEEGLNGRTVSLDEITPGRPFRNGLKTLPLILESHAPIALIVLMLGLNDTKSQFNKSGEEIAEGMRKLIRLIKTSDHPPRILLIGPPPLTQNVGVKFPSFNNHSVKVSKKLPSLFQDLALEESCAFFDASFIHASPIDGVHWDEDQVRKFGESIAQTLKTTHNL